MALSVLQVRLVLLVLPELLAQLEPQVQPERLALDTQASLL